MTQTVILVRTKSKGEIALSHVSLLAELRSACEDDVLSWSFIELDPPMPVIFIVRATPLVSGIAWSGEGSSSTNANKTDIMFNGKWNAVFGYHWFVEAESLEEAIAKAKQLFVDIITK